MLPLIRRRTRGTLPLPTILAIPAAQPFSSSPPLFRHADRLSLEGNATEWLQRLKQREAAAAAPRAAPLTPLVVHSIADVRALRAAMDIYCVHRFGRTARVGFVPTMGALHAGHLSLCQLAREGAASADRAAHHRATSDFLVSSIFVNPTQFAPHEDLSTYPRTFESDVKKLEDRGVDVVFAPTAVEMYPLGAPFRTFVDLAGVDSATPEGGARPGFFRGVATVVTKLLSIVSPTVAAFGQKDGVQCIAVRTLVRDLSLPVEVLVGATLREHDGLAMSSRNVYLTPEQRAAAPALFAGLRAAQRELEHSNDGTAELAAARQAVANRGIAAASGALASASSAELLAQAAAHSFGKRGAAAAADATPSSLPVPDAVLSRLTDMVARTLKEEGRGQFGSIDYITFSDALTGAPLRSLADSTAAHGAVMLSVAARIGKTRLLDNIMLIGDVGDLGAAAV